MKEKKLPTRFFVSPSDKFSNDIIALNSERGDIQASETKINYKEESLPVWEVGLEALRLLRKNKVPIPGFKFKVYAQINDRIQTWKLLDFRKDARVAKARKALRKIGQRKVDEKRQPPLA